MLGSDPHVKTSFSPCAPGRGYIRFGDFITRADDSCAGIARLQESRVPFFQNEVLVVENDVEEGTVDLQFVAGMIINEPQFPEPVHEKTDPRPRCAYHLCERLLTDLGDQDLGLAVLAELS